MTERKPYKAAVSLAAKFKLHGKEFIPPKDGVFNDRWLARSVEVMPFGFVIYDAKSTGLGISVAPSGRMTWCLQTTYPNQSSQARRKLGNYPALKLAAARLKASAWLALIESGTDPAEAAAEAVHAKQQERLAKALRDRQTFGAFAEQYISGRSNRRAAVDAQEIRRMLVSTWGPHSIHAITPRDVRELFAKLKAKAPFDAKNAFQHASGIFKAAVFQDLIAVSPLASVDKKQLFPKGTFKPRQRALTDEEVRAFWAASEQLGSPYRELFRLLLLTGARLNELAKARWSELDPLLRKALRDARGASVNWRTVVPDDIKTLTIPAIRFKSDREHVMQFSNDACAIVEQLRRYPGGEFMFSTTLGALPINGLSKSKQRLDALMLQYLRDAAARRDEDPARVELPPWVNHDLRRTVRTNLAALQVRFEVAETVLGHTLGGLHATYNVHTYAPEQREALELWAARLREITRPHAPTVGTTAHNIVALKQRKAPS